MILIQKDIYCPVGLNDCHLLLRYEEMRHEIAQLQTTLHKDGLTGLYNYKHLIKTLSQEMERTKRTGLPTSFIMMDLDFFKKVNDNYGHEAGNMVLKAVAGILQKNLRTTDTPCRYGGEEFSIILSGTKLKKAVETAERLRQIIEKTPIETASGPIHVTSSMGVSFFQVTDTLSPEAFLDKTDQFLLKAKKHGRNRVETDFLAAEIPVDVTPDEKTILFQLLHETTCLAKS